MATKLSTNKNSIQRRKSYRRNKKKQREIMYAWRRKHPIRWGRMQRKGNRACYARQKASAFAVLGNKCTNCGFTDFRALQIDHLNGGGNKERVRLGNSQTRLYKRIIKYPSKYQLLCANCNWIKRWNLQENKYKRKN